MTYAVAYVSSHCGACAKFLSMIQATPELLATVDLKFIDQNPAAILEMKDFGANKTPTLVVYDQSGRPKVYQATAALAQLMQLVPITSRMGQSLARRRLS